MTDVQPTGANVSKGYRGPRWLTMLGVASLLLGGAAAVAAFIIVQVQGVTGSAGGVVAEYFLGSSATGSTEDASLALVGIFVGGVLVAVAGLLSLVFGLLWSVVRFGPRNRAARGWGRARPVLAGAGDRGQQEFRAARTRLSPSRSRRSLPVAPNAPAPALMTPAESPLVVSGRPLTAGDPLAPEE